MSPGGHASLPGLGRGGEVVCGMESMPPTCIVCSPGCPIPPPEDGWEAPGLGTGHPGGNRACPSPGLAPVEPPGATGLERTTGLFVQTRVLAREVTL